LWLWNAESTMDHVACEMARAGNGVGEESWFLPKARDGVATVLDFADMLRKQSAGAMKGR